jgi:hypothetical protein
MPPSENLINYPRRHAEKVADVIGVAIIFIEVAMDKPNPLLPLHHYRKGEEEKINLQHNEPWRSINCKTELDLLN